MPDQATRLREIATELYDVEGARLQTGQYSVPRSKVIAVTSGKGGVGKTSVAVNLALKLKEYDNKVLLIDTDINLANADIVMGISPQFSLADAVIKDYNIKDVIVTGPRELHFLPGGSGFLELLKYPSSKRAKLIRQLEELEQNYDFLVLDTPAGLNKQIIDFLTFATQIIILATPEPTSIADAYAMVKVLTLQKKNLPMQIILNQVGSEEQAKDIYRKFTMVTDRFLNTKIRYLGHIISDRNVSKAVLKQRPLVMEFPRSSATRCLENIAERIITRSNAAIPKGSGSFFEKLGKISVFN